MRNLLLALAFTMLLAGCAAEPDQPTSADTAALATAVSGDPMANLATLRATSKNYRGELLASYSDAQVQEMWDRAEFSAYEDDPGWLGDLGAEVDRRGLRRGAAASAATAPTAPAPAGPPSTMADGTWEIGVDVQQGKYKTAGGDSCYWERLRHNDGSLNDTIQNYSGAGPQTVTVRAAEYLRSQRCGTWTKVGG